MSGIGSLYLRIYGDGSQIISKEEEEMKKKNLKKGLAMVLTAATVCSLAMPAAAGEVAEEAAGQENMETENTEEVVVEDTQNAASSDVTEEDTSSNEGAAAEESAAAETDAAAEENAEAAESVVIETDGAQDAEAENESADDTPVEGQISAVSEENAADETDKPVEGEITAVSEETADTQPVGEIEVDSSSVNADDNVVIAADDKPYLALGENLSADQRAKVLDLMGIDAANLDDYNVVYVSNAQEHQYLDEYLPSEKIGTRALSSVVIVKREEGNGLNISTKNINYCTIGMYKNALATAGLKDADIIVAGPTPISGTAALIGAMQAYSEMTGEPVDEESLDAAMNEIVVTGELSDILTNAEDGEVEEFIAYVKQKVLEGGLKDESSIRKCIEEALDKYDFSMTDDEIDEIVKVLLKISKLDIDVDSLLDQAKTLYDKVKNSQEAQSLFARIIQAIQDFIKNLFQW